MIRFGNLIVQSISCLILILIYYFLKTTRFFLKQNKRLYQKLRKKLFWNDSLRLFLEVYQPSLLLALTGVLNNITWQNPISKLFTLIDMLTLTLCILIPCYITVQLKRGKCQKKKIKGVLRKLSSKRQSAYDFFTIFCYRRLSVLAVIVTAPPLQVLIAVQINFIAFVAFLAQKPYVEQNDIWLELINEVLVLLAFYHLFAFTDFVLDPEVRFTMGYSLITVTSFAILVNCIVLAWSIYK